MEINSAKLIIFTITIGIVFLIIYLIASRGKKLDSIKSKQVGDGQYGNQKWADKSELMQNLKLIPYEPQKWRTGKNRPQYEGIILGSIKSGGKVSAYLDTSDNHTMFISAPGGGKTTTVEYPNYEYAAAIGMPFFSTDTKGDAHQDYVPILNKYYGYKTYVIDLRNPAKSDSYNIMYLVNKYTDKYKSSGNLADKAKSESYAKVLANCIIHMDGFKSAGQNQYFYEAAEGAITGVTLLISELCKPEERHVVSVFKIIQQLMEIDPSTVNKKGVIPTTYLTKLYSMLPNEHKAKWYISPAATSAAQTIASVMSTAMSRMLAFIDSEMEQLLCFDCGLDIEEFIQEKSAIFFVIDEKSNTKNFLVSLLIRQTYNELLCASEDYPKNRLPHRVYYYLDEFGTYSAIERVDQMFSAGRSRGIICCPFLQGKAQLDQKYDRETSKVIKDTCQNVMFSFLSPTSEDAEDFSKLIGDQTILSGSISKRSSASSASGEQITYNMIKKPLITADQIKRMKKGEWILMKTGMHPAQMKMPKYEDWGLSLEEEPYKIREASTRKVYYADRERLLNALQIKYGINNGYNKNLDNNNTSTYIPALDKKQIMKEYI